jgi:hypothetical protein
MRHRYNLKVPNANLCSYQKGVYYAEKSNTVPFHLPFWSQTMIKRSTSFSTNGSRQLDEDMFSMWKHINIEHIIIIILFSTQICPSSFFLYITCYSNKTTINSSKNDILHTIVTGSSSNLISARSLETLWHKGSQPQAALVIVCLFFH